MFLSVSVYAGTFVEGFMDPETGEVLTYEQALERGIVEEKPETPAFPSTRALGDIPEEEPPRERYILKEEVDTKDKYILRREAQ